MTRYVCHRGVSFPEPLRLLASDMRRKAPELSSIATLGKLFQVYVFFSLFRFEGEKWKYIILLFQIGKGTACIADVWRGCTSRNDDKHETVFTFFCLSSMPYVKGQKYDIQFTFNRLPVQMEHRACEQITAATRQEMCHVLFPQEQSLDQRGELNKTVRQVLVGD